MAGPGPGQGLVGGKLLRRQNYILSKELKTANERHITLIQFLKLENFKQDQMIKLLEMKNEALCKELTLKEKQVASLTAFVEESEQSLDSDSAAEKEGGQPQSGSLNDLEIRLKDMSDDKALIEEERNLLRRQKRNLETQVAGLKSKNLELMQELELMRAGLDRQSEALQRLALEKKTAADRADLREKETGILKKKVAQCEEYILELERTVGMQSRGKGREQARGSHDPSLTSSSRLKRSRRSFHHKTESLPMDKIMSPDIRVVPGKGQFQHANPSLSFQPHHLHSLMQVDPRLQCSSRNLRWQSKTNLIRPKDTLNLFGRGEHSAKENTDQLNQAQVRRRVTDFPSYDVFQKSQNLFIQLNQELSRQIERKKHFQAELSKIPIKLRHHKVEGRRG